MNAMMVMGWCSLHAKYIPALGRACGFVYTILTLGLLSQLNMMEEGIEFLN